MSDLYREVILEEVANPQNKGNLVHATHKHQEQNASCGDSASVDVKVEDGVIVDIAWQGTGCAISQAGISLLSEEVKGKSVAAVNKLGEPDMLALMGLTEINPGRRKCLLLGLKLIQEAIIEKKEKAQ